MPLQGKVCRI
eukprot:CCRYP_007293-RA/>CCRYP_007293-RA protein AED:0.45 eAED:1.00 QI:0/-1/0/1/-1/0/1/0/10